MDTVKVKNLEIGGEKPVFIGGPCSIESRDHIIGEAKTLKKIGVDILRGGAFKPRTDPHDFTGIGIDGAKYLHEAGQITDLPVVSEVMSITEIEDMYEFVDIFQVGSRNMYNYPLLTELGKQDKPILLKRAFSATLKEWIGAAEYVIIEGNKNIIFCERGIRTFNEGMRNTLDLAGAVLLRQMTNKPVIADPSHGTGRRELIEPMAKAALAAGLDGVMIEVHPNPDHALSDGDQSIDYETYEKIRSHFD